MGACPGFPGWAQCHCKGPWEKDLGTLDTETIRRFDSRGKMLCCWVRDRDLHHEPRNSRKADLEAVKGKETDSPLETVGGLALRTPWS